MTKNIKKEGSSEINRIVKKVLLLTFVLLCFFFVLSTRSASAATVTWDGGGADGTCGGGAGDGNKWSCGLNWSTNTVPTSADVATFNATSVKDATMDATINVIGINIASTYSGTISPSSAIAINVGATGFVQAGGTFTSTEGILTIGGNFTKTGGTFNEGTGTVSFTVSSDRIIDVATTETFYNVNFSQVSGGDGSTISSGDTLVVAGTLNLTDGYVNGPGVIDARGNIIQAATFDGGSANIDFGDNAVVQTYTINGGVGSIIRFDNASDANDFVDFNATTTLYGLSITSGFGANAVPMNYNKNGSGPYNLTVGVGGYTQAEGTFIAPAISTFNANFTKTGGTFDEGTGTVNFTVVNDYTINVATTETFYNVNFSQVSGGDGSTISSGDTLVVAGTLNLTDGYVNGPGVIDARGNIIQAATFDGGSVTIDFGDNSVIQTFTFNGGTGPAIRFDNASDANDFVDFNATATLYGLSITSGFGANPVPINYNKNGSGPYNLTLGAGGYSQAEGAFTAPALFTLYDGGFIKSGGTFVEGTSTLTFGGTSNVTVDVATTETFYNVVENLLTNDTLTIGAGDTIVVAGALTLTDGAIAGGTFDARGNIVQGTLFHGGTTMVDFGDNAVAQTYTINGVNGIALRFDNASDANDSVIFNAASTLYSLNITSGFGANPVPITYNGYNLTIGAGGYTQAEGTFTAPSSLTISGGNFTKTGGTFVEDTGTVIFTGASTYNASPSETFFNVIKESTSVLTITTAQTIIIAGTLTLTDGTINTGVIDTRGNIVQASTFDGGTATIDFGDNAVVQTYTINGGVGSIIRFDNASDANDFVDFNATTTLYGLSITSGFGANAVPMNYNKNGSGPYNLTVGAGGYVQAEGTFTAPADMTISGVYTQSSGTFNASSSLTINGSYTQSGGTFVGGTTMTCGSAFTHTAGGVFTAPTTFIYGGRNVYIDVATTETFNNFQYNVTGGWWADIATGDTLVVTGTLTLIDGPLGWFGSGSFDVKGDVVIAATADENRSPIIFSGSAVQTFTTNNLTIFNGDITINKSGGQVNLVGNLTMDYANQDLIIQEGTLDLNGSNITVTGGATQTLIVQDGGVLRLQGDETISASATYPSFLSGSTVFYDGTSGPYTLKDYTYSNLSIGGVGATFNLPASVTLKDLTVTDGTLDVTASNYNFTLSGNLTVSSPGTINNRSNTVTFNGANQTIAGDVTFNNFTSPNSLFGSNLMGYWKLDETVAGSTVVDSSGNGYDGTPLGAGGTNNLPQPNASVPTLNFTDLRSLNFDATDDYFSLPNMSASITTEATFSVWVKRATHTPTTQKNSGSWFWNTSNSGSIYPWTDGIIYDGTFRASRYTVGAGVIADRTQWHHVAITSRPGANGWNFYQNGSLVASTTGDNTISLAAIPKIGESQGSATNNFNGLLDDVRLYNRALTADEVALLASGDSGSGDSTLTFTAGSTQTVNGTLTLSGLDTDNRVNLVSSVLGTPWNLVVNGTNNVIWTDVRDSHASGTAIPITHSNTVNSGGNENWGFDEISPSITNVTSDKADNTYGAGEVIDIDFTFSEAISTTGDITVTLNSGGTCTFNNVTNSATASCNYTVQAGENSSDLSVSNVTGTIKDQSLNQLTDFTPTTNLAANKALVIDTTAPVITSISSNKTNGRYKAGEVIDIDLTFSKAVTSTGDITVTLETGATDRTCTFQVTNSTTASCDYTVQAGDTTADLNVNSVSGTINDQFGNSMLVFTPTTNLAANKALVIDTTAPTVTSHTPVDEATGIGLASNLVLQFSETVVVGTGSVTIKKISDNSTVETIDITSGQVTGTNSQRITVNPGSTFDQLTAYYIEISNTAIKDLANNNYAGISGATAWNFSTGDIGAPIILSVTSTLPNGTYNTGAVIPVTVTFSEAVSSNGSVTVTFNTGATCTFTVLDALTGTCSYTVATGHAAPDLNVSSIVGNMEDQSNNALTDLTPLSNLIDSSDIVIDAAAPDLPVATPPGATYTTIQTVTLSSVGSSAIYYTLNGDVPTTSSTLYSSPVTIDHSVTLKALAVDEEENQSEVLTEAYVINLIPDNSAPVASMPFEIAQATDGSRQISFKVNISDPDNQATDLKIEYSLNNKDWQKITAKKVTVSKGTTDINNDNDRQLASIDTNEGSVSLTILWDALLDLEARELSEVYLRVIPFDGTIEGNIQTTDKFSYDGRAPQIADFAVTEIKEMESTFGWTVPVGESNFGAYKICFAQTATAARNCQSSWEKEEDKNLSDKSTHETMVTGLTLNTGYYFILKAVDTFGNEKTLELTKKTTLAPAATPTPMPVAENKTDEDGGGNGGKEKDDEAITPTPSTKPVTPPLITVPKLKELLEKIIPTPPAHSSSAQGSISPKLPEIYLNSLTGIFGVLMQDKNLQNLDYATTAIAIATIFGTLSLFTTLFTLVQNIPYFFQYLLHLFSTLFSLKKNRRPWGRLVNFYTGEPVEKALVMIVDAVSGKVKAQEYTNKEGYFASFLPAGQYLFLVSKYGWELTPENPRFGFGKNEQVYTGQPIVLTEETVASLLLVLKPTTTIPGKLQQYVLLGINKLEAFLAVISWPMILLGFMINTCVFFNTKSVTSIVIMVMYLAIAVTKLIIGYRFKKTLGLVCDKETSEGLSLAIIRLYDIKTNRLITVRATTEAGKFMLLVSPGVYGLTVTREKYKSYVVSKLNVQKSTGVLAVEVGMERK